MSDALDIGALVMTKALSGLVGRGLIVAAAVTSGKDGRAGIPLLGVISAVGVVSGLVDGPAAELA